MSGLNPTSSVSCKTCDDVLPLLREQSSLYSKLEAVARKQRSLISLDDSRPLLDVLAQRQKLTTELTMIAGKLKHVREEWDAYTATLAAEDREEANRLVNDVKERLTRLVAQDEEDARLLSAKKEETACMLRATYTTAQAVSAYGAPAGGAEHGGLLREES